MSDERRDLEATDVPKNLLRAATDGRLDLPRPADDIGDSLRDGVDRVAVGDTLAERIQGGGGLGRPNPEDPDDDLGPGGPRMRDVLKDQGPEIAQG